MVITTIIAYITATFMIETVSVANAEDTNKRSDTLYGAGAYKNPMI
jgi:hypothetical protein